MNLRSAISAALMQKLLQEFLSGTTSGAHRDDRRHDYDGGPFYSHRHSTPARNNIPRLRDAPFFSRKPKEQA